MGWVPGAGHEAGHCRWPTRARPLHLERPAGVWKQVQVSGLDVGGPGSRSHASQWAVEARMQNVTPFHDRFGAKLLTHTDQLAGSRGFAGR